MPRIGEILLNHGWVAPDVLQRALAQHNESGMRTCSFLIECGALSSDNASRALGEQHGVAALLQKHFERRDHSLAQLLPTATAQLYTAIPIGRSSSGEVIVCLRDPKPELKGILSRAMKETVVLAVAPASQLTDLVRQVYGDDAAEFDVDMGTQPIPVTLNLELDEIGEQFQLTDLDDASVHKDHSQTSMPITGGRGGMSGAHALPPKELFDAPTVRGNSPLDAPTLRSSALEAPTRPTRSGGMGVSPLPPRVTAERPASPSVPPATRPSVPAGLPSPRGNVVVVSNPDDPPTARASYDGDTVRAPVPSRTMTPAAIAAKAAALNPASKVIDALARGTQPPERELSPTGATINDTITALGKAATPQAVAETALRYIANRWRASVLFAIEGYEAVGMHGHGAKLQPEVVRSLSISLDGPSILRSAQRAPNSLITTLPPGGDEVHDQLERLLSVPQFPAAVAIGVGSVVDYVLVVGDPQRSSDVQAASNDLQRLATAMSAAYQRLER